MSETENIPSNLTPDTRVLRDDELDSASGGKSVPGDFVIVHKLDKASPVLFQA